MSENRIRASKIQKSFLIFLVLALGFTSGASAAPNHVGSQAPVFQEPGDDGDGIDPSLDNCPQNFNPDQEDTNGDGIGNACDFDMDGIENLVDNCPWTINPDQQDSNGNGAGDACDNGYDLDLDGIFDGTETYLIQTFAPIVYLHSEDYARPAGVEWLFQRSDAPLVFDFGIWPEFCNVDPFYGLNTLYSPINDGINLVGIKARWEFFSGGCREFLESSGPDGVSMHFAIDMVPVDGFHYVYNGDLSSAPFYATVARGVYANTFTISYWFFYPYNGCGFDMFGVEYCDWTHEGDWEHIVVWVATGDAGATYQPFGVDYYYHGELARYSWGDVIKEGNRPIVFSALNTHASYPYAGSNFSCVAEDDLGTCWYWRKDYTNLGPRWDPLATGTGIFNVGERPLPRSRDYLDPNMGVPMPGMEWILYQGKWGLDGPGTPTFEWYEGQVGFPPAVYKVPDQTASAGIDQVFDIGPIRGFPGTTLLVGIDWGDGTGPTTSSPPGDHFYHTANHNYAAPGEYLVNVVAVDQIYNHLWGGNVFKVTVNDGPAITSATSTTFTVGSSGSFAVTTSGIPVPSIGLSGTLPSGVTFVDHGDGTATLAGTPAAGTGGVYPIAITASNGIGMGAGQLFTLTVNDDAPVITSANSTTFTVGSSGSFTVTTSGFPLPAIDETGALPSGVAFVDNGDGTGTLSGTPASDSQGIYDITFTASNGVSPNYVQDFALTVGIAPAITSADTAAFEIGQANSFTVTAVGFPVVFLSESGALPAGVSFVDNGDNTATLSGTPAIATNGIYHLVFTAQNTSGPDATQDFALHVDDIPVVTVVNSIADTGDGLVVENELTNAAITQLLVVFSNDMDATEAQDVSNYSLVQNGVIDIAINSITYSSSSQTATLNVNDGVTLPNGNYALTVRSALHNTSDIPMAADFVRSFVVDTSHPAVLPGGVTGQPGDQVLTNGGVFTSHFTSITVSFNSDVNNSAGGLGTDDVTNPLNYLLLRSGPNNAYDTTDCLSFAANGNLPLGDDIHIPTGPVTYTNNGGAGPFVATVIINGGLPLPEDEYRLLICGTTSIIDLAGNSLNDGTDTSFIFRIYTVAAPATGFAPGATTRLPQQPASLVYSDLGSLWLEIPTLGVQSPIVGVPIGERAWDVTWLYDQIGWLEGTAYPTWSGNSVLTAHAYTADGLPGPFAGLGSLAFGNLIVVHMDGLRYTYALRTNNLIYAENSSYITRHEDYSWLTLVTCEQYDERTGSFRYRRVVRAVLISVTPEH